MQPGGASSTPWTAIAYSIAQGAQEAKRAVTKAIDTIQSAVESLASKFNKLKSIILETVDAFQPFMIVMFNRAILDLKATLGQIFIPIVRQAIDVIRFLADTIYNLPVGFKNAIRAIANIVLSISGIASVGLVVASVIGTFVGALVSLATAIVVAGAALSLLWPIVAAGALIIAPFVVILAGMATVIAGVSVLAVQLVRMMARTTGGMVLLTNIMTTLDQVITFIQGSFSNMSDSMSGVLGALYQSLSQLGLALSDLLNALKPIIALHIIGFINMVTTGLTYLAIVLTVVSRAVTNFTRILMSLPFMRRMAGLGAAMPTGGPQASSYGLGWAKAQVGTDPNAIYNRITEELLRNTRMGGEPKRDPQEEVAKNVAKWSDLLQQALQKFLGQQPGRRAIVR